MNICRFPDLVKSVFYGKVSAKHRFFVVLLYIGRCRLVIEIIDSRVEDEFGRFASEHGR